MDPITPAAVPAEAILILDFGSQVTQLIARRVREAGVYCEIVPFQSGAAAIARLAPKGIILSGGPASIAEASGPRAPDEVFDGGSPVLGICYGEQAMAAQQGGTVEASHGGEFGRAFIDVTDTCGLFDGVWQRGERHQVWMSHGDRITALPAGFRAVATSDGAPFAAIADDARRHYGVQFHPEVMHTPDGAKLIANFVRHVAGCAPTWSMAGFRAAKVAAIRAQVGDGRVICGLSGGVDSSVAAVLIHEAIGDQLTCVFVDTGLLRTGEAEQVVTLFREHYHIPLIHVNAADVFLGALAGVTDPEAKRKLIGRTFIDVFDAEARKIAGARFLAQGTLYPDVIESVSYAGGPSVTIKSHHNVGGPPRTDEPRLGRTPARAVQGRGPRAGPRARPDRGVRRAPPVPRPRPRDPHSGRGDGREMRHPARRRHGLPRRDPRRRAVRCDLAGVRRPAPRPHRRRHGRRPDL